MATLWADLQQRVDTMNSRKLSQETITLSHLNTRPKKPVAKPKDVIDELQLALLRIQRGFLLERKRAILLLEGTDSAGKGGIIRRLTRHMDPRGVRVWPIGPPKAWEQSRHYLYRFWQRLPEPGEIVVFDRSWYGRVLVERVEGHAKQPEWKRAYRELCEFEQQLTDDGVVLVKMFLNLSFEEQYQRFLSRLNEPTKRWKLTPSDLESRRYWDDYQEAYQDMLNFTATENAPWHVIPADDKQSSRVEALTLIKNELQSHVNLDKINLLDPQVERILPQYFKPEDLKHD